MKAIRIDGTEVLSWNRLLARESEHNLVHWDSKAGTFPFVVRACAPCPE